MKSNVQRALFAAVRVIIARIIRDGAIIIDPPGIELAVADIRNDLS